MLSNTQVPYKWNIGYLIVYFLRVRVWNLILCAHTSVALLFIKLDSFFHPSQSYLTELGQQLPAELTLLDKEKRLKLAEEGDAPQYL